MLDAQKFIEFYASFVTRQLTAIDNKKKISSSFQKLLELEKRIFGIVSIYENFIVRPSMLCKKTYCSSEARHEIIHLDNFQTRCNCNSIYKMIVNG